MTGSDSARPFDGERNVIELAADRTITLRLHVSFLTSLFQHLGIHIRELRRGTLRPDGMNPNLMRFAAACPPIEILRWGEYAARDAAGLRDIGRVVKLRADEWATNLDLALDYLADRYRVGSWPQERTALLESQRWLATKVAAVKDDIILGIRRGLLLPDDSRPIDVVLVRTTYDASGAHSHPALVDTGRFAGADLIETLFHEVGHELLDRSVGLNPSGIAALDRIVRSAATQQVTVYDVLHILLFAQVGSLVREHFDRMHRPLLYEGGRLARVLQRMRVTAPVAVVINTLERYADGQIGAEQLARIFTDQ